MEFTENQLEFIEEYCKFDLMLKGAGLSMKEYIESLRGEEVLDMYLMRSYRNCFVHTCLEKYKGEVHFEKWTAFLREQMQDGGEKVIAQTRASLNQVPAQSRKKRVVVPLLVTGAVLVAAILGTLILL